MAAKLPEDRRAVFTDVYKFYERYWDMENTVESWTECARELGPIATKHGNSHLVRNLMTALYQTIEEDIKDMEAI